MADLSLQTKTSEAPLTWNELKAQCAELLKTGFLPQHIKTPEQAAAIALKGRELGIGIMEALAGLYVIQGKVAMEGQLMLARAYRTGQVEYIKIDSREEGCKVVIKRTNDAGEYTAFFGPVQAIAMGLSGKDNYKKQKKTMYKWRAISDAVRTKFADAIGGAHTPEELGVAVRVVGENLEVVESSFPVSEAPSETSKPTGHDRVINDAEFKLLCARADDSGIGEKDIKAYVSKTFGKAHRKELTVSELTTLLNWIKTVNDPPAEAQ